MSYINNTNPSSERSAYTTFCCNLLPPLLSHALIDGILISLGTTLLVGMAPPLHIVAWCAVGASAARSVCWLFSASTRQMASVQLYLVMVAAIVAGCALGAMYLVGMISCQSLAWGLVGVGSISLFLSYLSKTSYLTDRFAIPLDALIASTD